MDTAYNYSIEHIKYLKLLSKEFPTRQSVCTEIINLSAIMHLPKGTEHFMSDIHGEYEAFKHIINNCSGVIKEKIGILYGDELSEDERMELCTLIYYPREKLAMIKEQDEISDEHYKVILKRLINIARLVSGKYTRSKVRKALPQDFAYIIDELLHAQPDEDNNQLVYHEQILDTIIGLGTSDDFIEAISELIKRLAVDHLHIVGDIFDRGSRADDVMDLVMKMHSIDIEWGNHDILWMGAAAGNMACIANVIRNNIRYDNTRILESGYGISLRPLTIFAESIYTGTPMECAIKAINVLVMKLEGQLIKRHPEYDMDDRLIFDKINYDDGTVSIDGITYILNSKEFPTVDRDDPYKLTDEEMEVMEDIRTSFIDSKRLRSHVEFLYSKGSLYKIFNGNLLYHGCVPLDAQGNFACIKLGDGIHAGKRYMDFAEHMARLSYFSKDRDKYHDFMWYLWGGTKSPLCGRKLKTFERTYIDDEKSWDEPQDKYYTFYKESKTCDMILREFGLYGKIAHIINGHTPIHVSKGESPVKADGKLIVIDGGFCKAYQAKTGIAGYTLIYNSHGMRIKAHQPFESKEKALEENVDIESSSDMFESEENRVMVADSDNGHTIAERIKELSNLLDAYRQGIIAEPGKI